MPTKTCTIYGLREAGKKAVRYIGQTTYPLENRLKRHWAECGRTNKTARANWMRSVRDSGGDIEIIPLEENAEWNAAEIRWIAEYRKTGRLLNHTEGGQGWTPGKPFSEKHIQSMCKAQKKQAQNPEFIRKCREAALKRLDTPEGQRQMADVIDLVRSSPEFEERRIKAVLKSRKDPEFRRKMVEATTKQMADPAARQHLAEVNRERMKDPKNRQMASDNAKKGWQDPQKRAARIESLRKAALRRHERERRAANDRHR